jgi:hypothetical protein
LANLHCPLSNPPCCFFALEDAHQWSIRDDKNNVRQVVFQLPNHHEDYIEQLLNLRVPYLRILKDLIDKVHRFLLDYSSSPWPFNGNDGANYRISGYYIE